MVMMEGVTLLMKHVNVLVRDNSVGDAPSDCVKRRSRESGEDPCRTWFRC